MKYPLLSCLFALFAGTAGVQTDQALPQWELASKGPWSAREGLMGVSFGNYIYMTGGRSNNGTHFNSDVWRSLNGTTWELVTQKAPWAPRAYHIMVNFNNCIYLMGGQNFLEFFNDCWTTCDGTHWTQATASAPWHVRAGLAAEVFNGSIVMTGGSYQKPPATPTSPRYFYNDVWSTQDGTRWTLLTAKAPFPACSGPRLSVQNSTLFLLGGEHGFSSTTQYNHVYATNDGSNWRFISNATWSIRSGHGVVVTDGIMYVIAGYFDLHDLWMSTDASDANSWKYLSNSTWNCENQGCGRFDFWALMHGNAIVTFGGSGAYSTFGLLYDETWTLLA